MIVKTISVTYGRKFNLAWGEGWDQGQYESLHVEETMWADLEEGDNETECEEALRAQVVDSVKALALPVLKTREARRGKRLKEGLEATEMVGK